MNEGKKKNITRNNNKKLFFFYVVMIANPIEKIHEKDDVLKNVAVLVQPFSNKAFYQELINCLDRGVKDRHLTMNQCLNVNEIPIIG